MANRAEQFRYILANMKQDDPNRALMLIQLKKEEKKLKLSKKIKRKLSDGDVDWKEYTVEALNNKLRDNMNKDNPTPTETPVGTVGLTLPVTETPKPTSTPEVTPTETPVGTVGLTVVPTETPKPTAEPTATPYPTDMGTVGLTVPVTSTPKPTPEPTETPEVTEPFPTLTVEPTPEVTPTPEQVVKTRAKRGNKE